MDQFNNRSRPDNVKEEGGTMLFLQEDKSFARRLDEKFDNHVMELEREFEHIL